MKKPPLPLSFRRSASHGRHGVIRIANQNGQLQVDRFNAWYTYWRDPYHLMLTVPWWGFFGIVSSVYLLINTVFAVLYLLEPDGLTGARSGSFEDAFFFSVHTLGSIGYGVIAPKTTYANTIVTLEAIMSLLMIAVVTGLAFARFARPTARIIFSKYAVIAPHNGVPTLTLRSANQRRNQILEAEARLYLIRDEYTLEGEFIRRFHELPLLRSRTPSFMLTWNIMHPISETSPLYGETPESLAASHAQLIVSLIGIDETVTETIHARNIYSNYEVMWDHYFMDIFHLSQSGDRYLDYRNFHKVQPRPNLSTTHDF
ncbi:ion channel [Alkalinema sp. FACHB-956]|uniref:ion channel n=1 Tax=Alkalinema sp. FACHB-956 TaxID=2692768 RepID=UPI00168A2606|nr:ion channel [Alkalinema sp. FACHB-956]MBD2328513.1 ATP-sensitive inward rectifier potassium channel 10 [Alkalinema sp. FACHB-956]